MVRSTDLRGAVLGCLIFGTLIRSAVGQCVPQWFASPLNPGGGIVGSVRTAIEYNDGNATSVYVGGEFRWANGFDSGSMARWDGAKFVPLPTPEWSAVVHAMTTFDEDGAGPMRPNLFVGEKLSNFASGHLGVRRFDGSSWSPLGTGLNGGPSDIAHDISPSMDVRALVVHDDGTGPALYVCGNFVTAGDIETPALARWDGSNWTGFGLVLQNKSIQSAASIPSGPAAGLFVATRDGELFKWDGTSLTSLTLDPQATGIDAVTALDPDGSGPLPFALFAMFRSVNSTPVTVVNGVFRYDGTNWTQLGGTFSREGDDLGSPLFHDSYRVGMISSYDPDGSGQGLPRLVACSSFTESEGLPVNGVVEFNGTAWVGVGIVGHEPGLPSLTWGVAEIDPDNAGPRPRSLMALGSFRTMGGVITGNTAMWENGMWSPFVNEQVVDVSAAHFPRGRTVVYDADGSGPDEAAVYTFTDTLFAGDPPTKEYGYRWNGGTNFDHLPGELQLGDGEIFAATTFDPDGAGPVQPTIVIGGSFTVAGGASFERIARWTGAAWEGMGLGLGNPAATPGQDVVTAVFSFDPDLTGPEPVTLYAFGATQTVDGTPLTGSVAQWNGTSWIAPTSTWVTAPNAPTVFGIDGIFVPFDDGSGPALFHKSAVNTIVKWNGASWAGLGGPGTTSRQATGLAVFDDGTGPAIYASFFSVSPSIGGRTSFVAKWDGSTWIRTGTGAWDSTASNNTLRGRARATLMGTANDGAGHKLIISGDFDSFDGFPANSIAYRTPSGWEQLGEGSLTGSGGGAPGLTVLRPKGLQTMIEFTPTGGRPNVFFGNTLSGLQINGTQPAFFRWGVAGDCLADFNCSQAVTVQDIFDFLSAWFAGEPAADFNHAGGVTVQDIFDFLSAWFAGC